MSKKLIITAVLVVAILAGWYLFLDSKINRINYSNTKTPESSSKTDESSQIPETGISIVVNEQNNSGESGIATISEIEGKVVVNLRLVGLGFSAPQPSHLHLGTCGAPGEVVYSLTNVVNGQSQTTLDVDMETFSIKPPLILNVHKSEAESDIYVSCGQVSL